VADGDREDIWVHDVRNDTLTRRTYEGQNRAPVWTGDGQRLVYTTLRDAMQHLTSQLATGGGLETLVSSRNNLMAGAWTPDGQSLVYVDSPPTDLSGISVVARDGGWRSRPLVTQPVANSPTLSPDGRWMAFASLEGARNQIVVQPYPGPGPRHQLTTDGGDAPVWSRAGKEVFYAFDGAMYAVPIDTSHGFTPGKPVRLFAGPYVFTEPGLPGYDVSRDGRRFLMVKRGEAEVAPRQFRVVLNWADELMRRVPTSK
jgi:Tol biopolymer transport system component